MAGHLLQPLVVALLVVLANSDEATPAEEPSFRNDDNHDAKRCQLPHQALVLGDGKHVCGGALITTSAVLTAALCTATYKELTIRLGGIHRVAREPSAWVVVATRTKEHPDYRKLFNQKAVSIVMLPKNAPLSGCIKPVVLPSIDEVEETFVGQHGLISGWGSIDDSSVISETLRWTEVTVISNKSCIKIYNAQLVSNSVLCAGKGRRNISEVDYGSALVLQTKGGFKQIGVAVFWQTGDSNSPKAVGFTRVTSYLNWISKMTGISV